MIDQLVADAHDTDDAWRRFADDPQRYLRRSAELKGDADVLLDHRSVSEGLRRLPPGGDRVDVVARSDVDGSAALVEVLRRQLPFSDAARHDRLRRRLVPALLSAAREVRPVAEEVADRLVGAARFRIGIDGVADWVRDVAVPMPRAVLAATLGLPDDLAADTMRASDDLLAFATAPFLDDSVVRATARRVVPTAARLAAARSEIAASGGIAGAIAAAGRGAAGEVDAIDDEEVAANILFVLAASRENVSLHLSTAPLVLARREDQLREGDIDPATAVDEALRYEPPVQVVLRCTDAEIEVGDRVIPARRNVVLLVGVANRDPQVFVEAERVDLRRSPNPHFGFGGGPHRCTGASVAHVQAVAVMEATLRHGVPTATRDAVWARNIYQRGLLSLKVTGT